MQGTLFVVQFVPQYAIGFDRVVSDLAFNFLLLIFFFFFFFFVKFHL